MRKFLYVICIGWMITAIIDHLIGVEIALPVSIMHKAIYLFWGAIAYSVAETAILSYEDNKKRKEINVCS